MHAPDSLHTRRLSAPLSEAGRRIIIATVMSPVGTTGLQTHVQEVSRYLANTGRPVGVVTPRSRANALATPVFAARFALDRVSEAAGVAFYRSSHLAFLTHALRRELRDGSDTVVYAQCPLSARAALDARRDPNQRVVMVVHYDGSQADEWSDKRIIRRDGRIYRSIRELENTTIPFVDGLVFVSASARRALLATVPGARAVPSAVVPNFVNAADSTASPSPLPDPGDLVSVGGLEVKKHHRYLLEVLAAANARGHRYTLDIIGSGPMYAELVDLRRALGLEDQVRLRGRITPARATLPGHRAYVHASLREAFPYALIEAMAAGLPIVAGATGGIPEMFDSGVEGWFWPLDDADAAARVLVDVLEHTDLGAAGAAAAARFDRDFAADVLGARLVRLLVDGFPAC